MKHHVCMIQSITSVWVYHACLIVSHRRDLATTVLWSRRIYPNMYTTFWIKLIVSNFRTELIFSLQSDERERQWHYTQLELISQKIRAIPLTSAQSVSNAQHLKNDIPHNSAKLQTLFPDSTFVPLLGTRLLCGYYEYNISTFTIHRVQGFSFSFLI